MAVRTGSAGGAGCSVGPVAAVSVVQAVIKERKANGRIAKVAQS
jgi:hypothetical protein